MSAPFRITRPAVKQVANAAEKTSEEAKNYAERLLKLIPAEVIGLYLVGKGIIASGQASETPLIYWVVWTVFCLIAVLIVRLLGTADPNPAKAEGQPQKPPQPSQIPAVLIACISYVLWIYSMGDVFDLLDLYEPKLAALMMLSWTFVVPYFYKGDPQ